MRMLEPGNDPKEQIFTGSCTNCKAKFEAKRAELHVESDFREPNSEFARADCTFCNAKGAVLLYPKKKVRS